MCYTTRPQWSIFNILQFIYKTTYTVCKQGLVLSYLDKLDPVWLGIIESWLGLSWRTVDMETKKDLVHCSRRQSSVQHRPTMYTMKRSMHFHVNLDIYAKQFCLSQTYTYKFTLSSRSTTVFLWNLPVNVDFQFILLKVSMTTYMWNMHRK